MTAQSGQTELINGVMRCKQTPTQTIWEHGLSVTNYYIRLLYDLQNHNYTNWNLSETLKQNIKFLLENQHPIMQTTAYLLWHDMGKPLCETIDNNGKKHYPNHAEISKQLATKHTQDPLIIKLIANDMLMHTGKPEDLQPHLENTLSQQDALTLYLCAIAECHSNAELFGGITTKNFQQKIQKIHERGEQAINYYRGVA